MALNLFNTISLLLNSIILTSLISNVSTTILKGSERAGDISDGDSKNQCDYIIEEEDSAISDISNDAKTTAPKPKKRRITFFDRYKDIIKFDKMEESDCSSESNDINTASSGSLSLLKLSDPGENLDKNYITKLKLDTPGPVKPPDTVTAANREFWLLARDREFWAY